MGINLGSAEPVTPGRDPANIDRRGLVGVGELATPRWTRGSSSAKSRDRESGLGSAGVAGVDEQVDEVDEDDGVEDDEDEEDVDVDEEQALEDSSVTGEVGEIDEQDAPDSPWTIEAIDGEGDDTEVLFCLLKPLFFLPVLFSRCLTSSY